MFKIAVVFAVLFAVALGRPQQQPEVTILRYENNNDGSGNYHYEYELSDGQRRDETGELKNVEGAEEPVVVMTGSWSYVDAEGKTHEVTYTADENGFHPVVSK
ncbi:endocuticle structural glycoprotein SgAbd-5-like [Condylostylus longicornis]|uniref:endocuticle structural glycoprotein SgAbd-5-like n=1 Tax=Condylostylus longicornis TaxID=2530218 RepID=UPI00244E2B5E|nr:endocuticle structural glycoprotein SgAbd-5-like [Condylostylus longicornis]